MKNILKVATGAALLGASVFAFVPTNVNAVAETGVSTHPVTADANANAQSGNNVKTSTSDANANAKASKSAFATSTSAFGGDTAAMDAQSLVRGAK